MSRITVGQWRLPLALALVWWQIASATEVHEPTEWFKHQMECNQDISIGPEFTDLENCLERKAIGTAAAVSRAETMVRDTINQLDYPTEQRQQLLTKFETEIKEFQYYQDDNCRFTSTITEPDDYKKPLRNDCITEMNIQRVKQLRAINRDIELMNQSDQVQEPILTGYPEYH